MRQPPRFLTARRRSHPCGFGRSATLSPARAAVRLAGRWRTGTAAVSIEYSSVPRWLAWRSRPPARWRDPVRSTVMALGGSPPSRPLAGIAIGDIHLAVTQPHAHSRRVEAQRCRAPASICP